MERREFFKTAGMSLAVLAVNPLELIPKREMLLSKVLALVDVPMHDYSYFAINSPGGEVGDGTVVLNAISRLNHAPA